jgi:hypothetical protein
VNRLDYAVIGAHTLIAGLLVAGIVSAQVEPPKPVREHRLTGEVDRYSTHPTRLYHYPDFGICVLRGFESLKWSEVGGPWAVVVPCPWTMKKPVDNVEGNR